MKKIILDFDTTEDKEEVQQYLAAKLNFPDYYGKNLDALYDCLTDICEPTAIGFFEPVPEFEDVDIDFMMYIDQIKDVFKEAERDNPDICVIFGDIVDNERFDDDEVEDFDPEDEEWLKKLLQKEHRDEYH